MKSFCYWHKFAKKDEVLRENQSGMSEFKLKNGN